MPLPQEGSFLIVAFMARESMPPPDTTTGCTAASPTVMCRTHRLSPDNTVLPHHPQIPHSSEALSITLWPPNILRKTTHRHIQSPTANSRNIWAGPPPVPPTSQIRPPHFPPHCHHSIPPPPPSPPPTTTTFLFPLFLFTVLLMARIVISILCPPSKC